jgi:hypothetical protein
MNYHSEKQISCLHTQYLIDEKEITPGKKVLSGDEKRFWALKRHGLSADEKNFVHTIY